MRRLNQAILTEVRLNVETWFHALLLEPCGHKNTYATKLKIPYSSFSVLQNSSSV